VIGTRRRAVSREPLYDATVSSQFVGELGSFVALALTLGGFTFSGREAAIAAVVVLALIWVAWWAWQRRRR